MSSIKRNTLILIISCAQLALLVVSLGFFTHWLKGELTQLVGAQIQADNQVILEQTRAYLEALNPGELTEGGENWQRVATASREADLAQSRHGVPLGSANRKARLPSATPRRAAVAASRL